MGIHAPGAAGGAPRLRRPARAAAPRPGVGRDRRQRRHAPLAAQATRAWSARSSTRRRSPGWSATMPARPRPRSPSATPATRPPAATRCPTCSRSIAASDLGELMLGHNGNLTNATWLRDDLTEQGVEFATASDTEVLAKLIAHAHGPQLGAARRAGLPSGHRRLHLHHAHRARPGRRARPARLPPAGAGPAARPEAGVPAGWAVASESAALDAMGAQFVRDVEPGEIVTIDDEGVHSHRPAVGAAAGAAVRLRVRLPGAAGQRHRRAPPVRGAAGHGPAAGAGAAGRRRPGHPRAGLAPSRPPSATRKQSGLPYREGLIKNRYVGRTFIQPAQRSREEAVRLKFNPLPEVLAGKRVVVVDDSIVRGHHHRRRSWPCCAGPARARCTSASTRRRCSTPATWASTPGAGRS